MKLSRLSVAFALLLCLSPSILLSQVEKPRGSQGLTLIAHRNGSPIVELNRSFLYTADLLSDSATSVDVYAAQVPGSFAGSGTFFACGLQTWSQGDHRWVLRQKSKLSEFGPSSHPNLKIKTMPGNQMEVCRLILPSQAGRRGDRARFIFQTKWNEAGSVKVHSNKFVIGEQASGSNHVCSTRSSSAGTLPQGSSQGADAPNQP